MPAGYQGCLAGTVFTTVGPLGMSAGAPGMTAGPLACPPARRA